MSEDSNNTNHKQAKDEVHIPDLAELWKEIYFKTENTLADSFREYIGTKNFVSLLDKTLEQYLANEKIARQNLDQYLEVNPIASKKDIARVAELVISLEEKIDNLEFQFSESINSMANSLLRMVDYQEKLKDEIISIKDEIKEVNEKVGNQNKRRKKSTPDDIPSL